MRQKAVRPPRSRPPWRPDPKDRKRVVWTKVPNRMEVSMQWNKIVSFVLAIAMAMLVSSAFADHSGSYVDGILFTGAEPQWFQSGNSNPLHSACPWDQASAVNVFGFKADGTPHADIQIIDEELGKAYVGHFAKKQKNYSVPFGVMQVGDVFYTQQQVIPEVQDFTWRCITNAEALRRGVQIADRAQAPATQPVTSQPQVAPPNYECKLAKDLANERGWVILSLDPSLTNYGGAQVQLPLGAQLPFGWEMIGSIPGPASIYPPKVCRAQLGVAS